MKHRLRQAIEARWYGKPGWLRLLWPLSILYRALSAVRRQVLERRQDSLACPVVVIGNITVGGTGKTPLLIALVQHLQAQGLRPGVVSRGYGSKNDGVLRVDNASSSESVGDEPLLIARATQCPVAVGRDRLAAARSLLQDRACDFILSDDGLQHYRLPRAIEIVVVDGSRGFGNKHVLPVGPLREPIDRLKQVDWVVRNGNVPCAQLESWQPVPMRLRPTAWVNVGSGERRPLDSLPSAPGERADEPAYAVAGIGNPQRFFATLNELGLSVYPKAFPDHHQFQPHDFAEFAGHRVLMTAKDAVKCQGFAKPNWWYLEIAAELPESFRRTFTERVQALVSAS